MNSSLLKRSLSSPVWLYTEKLFFPEKPSYATKLTCWRPEMDAMLVYMDTFYLADQTCGSFQNIERDFSDLLDICFSGDDIETTDADGHGMRCPFPHDADDAETGIP
jgi:hypothetical protein